MAGETWVETSADVIHYFLPKGLGKSEYFDYGNQVRGAKGVRVCLYGQSERLQKHLDRQLGQINFGDSESKVNMITETKPLG